MDNKQKNQATIAIPVHATTTILIILKRVHSFPGPRERVIMICTGINRTNWTPPSTPGRIKIKDDGWDITNKPGKKPKSPRVSMDRSRNFSAGKLGQGTG